MKTFCFEIYTKNPDTGETGWDIVNVIVKAKSFAQAKQRISSYPLFDCIITNGDWFGDNQTWPVWDGKKITGIRKD